jgi:hypothetical protein
MMIRQVAVSDHMNPPEVNDIFCAILGWSDNLGYIFRVHGQEFNRFRRKTRSSALHEFRLHRQEKFYYICDTLHLWVPIANYDDNQHAANENLCLQNLWDGVEVMAALLEMK